MQINPPVVLVFIKWNDTKGKEHSEKLSQQERDYYFIFKPLLGNSCQCILFPIHKLPLRNWIYVALRL